MGGSIFWRWLLMFVVLLNVLAGFWFVQNQSAPAPRAASTASEATIILLNER
ncbi:hypothetical protein [Nitrincola tibetensis]|uniref:hypothetical protein n=1 Tax=Nitrincola tibetensis TaxID=2219697 RepID=UPI0012E33F33|nr:hypothetical protein [Nitrincola tibetensis]